MGLTDAQIADRVNYIGGSDAAAVLGLSRWKTPMQVWAEKTGTVKPEDIGDQLPVIVGTELESLVTKLFCDKSGKKVIEGPQETITHPQYPFIRATPDAMLLDEDAGFEAKTASGWKAKEWEGADVPQEYTLQCLHNMMVTGKKKWYLACLIGGNQDFRWIPVLRDEKIISQMLEREVEFWREYVEPKVMPKVVLRDDADILFKMFPEGSDPEAIHLGDEGARLAQSILDLNEDKKALEGLIEKQRNELKAMLKDHAVGETDFHKITWKNQGTRRFDSNKAKAEDWDFYDKFCKDTKSRVLRVSTKKIKKEAGK